MLHDHLVDLSSVHLTTELLHRQLNVLLCDLARRVCVKLVEDGLQTRLCQELLDVDRGSQELTIIDLFVVVVVDLINHVLDLLTTCSHALCHQHIVQFLGSDHSRSVLVDGLELCAQILHLLLRGSLHEQVQSGLLECCYALESLQSLQHVTSDCHGGAAAPTDFSLTVGPSVADYSLKPGVLEGILPVDPLGRILRQELLNEVFALITDLVELRMVIVMLAADDLTLHGLRVLSLERQVSTDERVENDAQRPKIRHLPIRALDHFWCHVIGCACDLC